MNGHIQLIIQVSSLNSDTRGRIAAFVQPRHRSSRSHLDLKRRLAGNGMWRPCGSARSTITGFQKSLVDIVSWASARNELDKFRCKVLFEPLRENANLNDMSVRFEIAVGEVVISISMRDKTAEISCLPFSCFSYRYAYIQTKHWHIYTTQRA
jgi:hypothetical protein